MTTLTPAQQAEVLRATLAAALAQQWPGAGIPPAASAQDQQEFVQSEVWDRTTATPQKCAALVTAFIEKVKAGCADKTPVVLIEPYTGLAELDKGLNAYAIVMIGFLIPLVSVSPDAPEA